MAFHVWRLLKNEQICLLHIYNLFSNQFDQKDINDDKFDWKERDMFFCGAKWTCIIWWIGRGEQHLLQKRAFPPRAAPLPRSMLPSLSDLCCDANVLRRKQDNELLIHYFSIKEDAVEYELKCKVTLAIYSFEMNWYS